MVQRRASMISTIRGSGPAAPVGICTRAHPAYRRGQKSDGWERCQTSSNRIELEFRMPRDGICDPVVDVGFMPPGPVGADFELSWECALGDLTVDRRPG